MVEPERVANRVVGAARSNLALTPLIAVAGVLSSIVVVRALAPDLFALYALALALRGTAQFLADLGTGAASTRLFAEFHERGSRAQAFAVFIRLAAVRGALVLLLASAVALMPATFAGLLDLQDDERYFLVFVTLICGAEVAAGLGFYVLTGTFRHKIVNWVNLAQATFQPVAVIMAALLGTGLSGILGAILAGSVFRGIALNVGAVRTVRSIPEREARIEGYAAMYASVATGSLVGKVTSWVHSRQFVTPVVFAAVSRSQVSVFSIAYDWVHQVLGMASGPFYTLLLPIFSSRAGNDSAVREMFQFVGRTLVLVVLPTAGVFLAVFSSLGAVVFPGEHAEAYSSATDFAAILIPCFALEVILSGPATAVMLSHEALVKPYRRIKLVTLGVAGIYLLLAGVSLLVVTALMMAVRVGSAVALHVAIWSRLGIHLEFGWLTRAVFASGICSLAATTACQLVPGRVPDLVVGPTIGVATFLVLVRLTHLLRSIDVEIARRVLPFGHRALSMLTRP